MHPDRGAIRFFGLDLRTHEMEIKQRIGFIFAPEKFYSQKTLRAVSDVYPYYVAFFYQTLGIFFIFLTGNATNDVFFTTLLPIRKRHVVKARFATVIFFQLAQVLASIPFAILRLRLNPLPNAAGVDANAALFGLVLAMYGIFNIVFLPGFYHTAYQAGKPFLLASTAMLGFVIAAEAAIQLTPALRTALDGAAAAYLPMRLLVLAAGAGVYALLTWAAYRVAVRTFERLDL